MRARLERGTAPAAGHGGRDGHFGGLDCLPDLDSASVLATFAATQQATSDAFRSLEHGVIKEIL